MRSPTTAVSDVLIALAIAWFVLAVGLPVPAHAAPPTTATGLPRASAPPPVALVPGQGRARGVAPTGPVKVGVYLYSMQELDFSRNTFHPSFEVWFRWRGDSFDPLANLQIVGARATNVTIEDRRRLANDENYVVAHVDVIINETFDTGAFPFDRHRLGIEIESPFEDDYVVFEIDDKASMLDPEVFSPGWRLSGFKLFERRKTYPTSFGLDERVGDRYSTVVVEVVAERIGWRAAVDYFIGFIVCVLLCLLGYLMPVNLLAARTTLLTAATIAAVGNKYVVNSLAETSVTARLVNVAVVSAFAMVLIFMLTSVRAERIAEAGDRPRAERLNRNVGIVSAVVYAILMSFVFWRAFSAAPT